MNVLILGSGGREHAFAWKIAQSLLCKKLFVATGNAGTAQIAQNVNISLNDFANLGQFCIDNQIDLVLAGTETPLVEGITDFFQANENLKKIQFIGPTKAGAMLEGSKDFSKAFMRKYGIPTATARTFDKDSLQEGLAYLATHSLPIVLKADGLAAGKGVIITENREEAKQILVEMIEGGKFGTASSKVLIESYLKGIELSVFVLTDGTSYKILPSAKDYKRIGEGDTGLNTGGMGAVSPVPFADEVFMHKVEQKIIKPTLQGLKAENIDYLGFIFIGLMNVAGEPYVIEYNVRMGDPETEVVIPRIKSDFLELLSLAAQKRLSEAKLEIDDRTATTVMLVSGGYPEDFEKGKVMTGFEKVNSEVLAFHAGTALKEGKILTSGGRVVALTALAENKALALEKSYKAAQMIDYQGKYYRKDIGFDLA
ncbi:phosphoribosylamine--glycine ligase [Thermoflexibacter ruber]|uniref:Phosphoribosylamine--glycine ligase n=1 Tax=Thermoflexibacter ruber TaxID=1003 RepID=A0A1I2I8K6_9BACT|nr:phosphoribosylamine--glycine ligase [Thermoflexibacter ruber]SFF37983.1 phosphoribosylamine--glycine ligase [Thermoflexibacter ruber]